MRFDCAGTKEKPVGNGLVRLSLVEQRQHIELTLRKKAIRSGRRQNRECFRESILERPAAPRLPGGFELPLPERFPARTQSGSVFPSESIRRWNREFSLYSFTGAKERGCRDVSTGSGRDKPQSDEGARSAVACSQVVMDLRACAIQIDGVIEMPANHRYRCPAFGRNPDPPGVVSPDPDPMGLIIQMERVLDISLEQRDVRSIDEK